MEGTGLVKRWRTVHSVGFALGICSLLIIACVLLVLRYAAYMKNEPSMAELQSNLRVIQQGVVKPSRSGLILIGQRASYVTRANDGELTVLWSYSLAHDDNYFEGFLFCEKALATRKTLALGPIRGVYRNAPKFFMTHLTVDRKISEHWYHVQGEMYK